MKVNNKGIYSLQLVGADHDLFLTLLSGNLDHLLNPEKLN